jgi:hypothetical protein
MFKNRWISAFAEMKVRSYLGPEEMQLPIKERADEAVLMKLPTELF